jgi:hypothetical protein
MELLSRIDFYAIGRQYVLGRAKKIDPEIVDREGSDVNLLVAGGSFMAQAVSRQQADLMSTQFMDAGLSEEDLDRLVLDRYSGEVVRKGAAPALVTIEMGRPGNVAGAGTVAIGTKLISLDGTEYVTMGPASFDATQLSGVTVVARSVQAGTAFQVGKNQIRRFDNSALLFDPTIEINNPDPAAGAADRETQDELIERARAFFGAARRGILAAIEFGATKVPGVASAHAVEVLTTGNTPARIVLLYVADATGTSNAALANVVGLSLDEWRAAGITVLVQSSIPQLASVILALTFVNGVDTVVLTANIRNAVLEFINSLGVNQPLYRSDLGAVLSRFRESGLLPNNATIIAPAGDIVPDSGRTLRARLDDIVAI